MQCILLKDLSNSNDEDKCDLIAPYHTTLIKEGTFQNLVLQTPEEVESGLVLPPGH